MASQAAGDHSLPMHCQTLPDYAPAFDSLLSESRVHGITPKWRLQVNCEAKLKETGLTPKEYFLYLLESHTDRSNDSADPSSAYFKRCGGHI
jgi:hypothetical protein